LKTAPHERLKVQYEVKIINGQQPLTVSERLPFIQRT